MKIKFIIPIWLVFCVGIFTAYSVFAEDFSAPISDQSEEQSQPEPTYTVSTSFQDHFATDAYNTDKDAPLDNPLANYTIPRDEALQIGVRIWHNECAGKIAGLTSWNPGESFASLGIGHFLWFPSSHGYYSDYGTFPYLLKYVKSHSNMDLVPSWLMHGDRVVACPWTSREDFVRSQNDPRMRELRSFLLKTIPFQAKYMVNRLKLALPKILAQAPADDRDYIQEKFLSLMQTPSGVYALVDYINFKGEGIRNYGDYKPHDGDWGLLQVLQGMRNAPQNLTDLEAFVWSARHVLIRRVFYAAPGRHEERWLAGWLARLNKYLR
jgi:hypothetical protein